MTLHYQSEPWISDVLCQVLDEGAVTTKKLPFRPYTLPALIGRALVLRDKERFIENWRNKVRIFPEMLKRNIVRHFTPLLQESILELTTNAERASALACLFFGLIELSTH